MNNQTTAEPKLNIQANFQFGVELLWSDDENDDDYGEFMDIELEAVNSINQSNLAAEDAANYCETEGCDEHKTESCQKDRFTILTNDELDTLENRRLSKSTSRQTTWVANLFKSKLL